MTDALPGPGEAATADEAVRRWLLEAAPDPEAAEAEWARGRAAELHTGDVFDALTVSRRVCDGLLEVLGPEAVGPVTVNTHAGTGTLLLPPGTILRGGDIPLLGRCAGPFGAVPVPRPTGRSRGAVAWAIRPVVPAVLLVPDLLWSAFPAALDMVFEGMPPEHAAQARAAVLGQVTLLTAGATRPH